MNYYVNVYMCIYHISRCYTGLSQFKVSTSQRPQRQQNHGRGHLPVQYTNLHLKYTWAHQSGKELTHEKYQMWNLIKKNLTNCKVVIYLTILKRNKWARHRHCGTSASNSGESVNNNSKAAKILGKKKNKQQVYM